MSTQTAIGILKKLNIEITRSRISPNDKIYLSHYVDNALAELGDNSVTRWMLE